MRSIRSRLLAWLLMLFGVIWLLVTLATYLESRHEVEELFDAQLSQSAAVLAELDVAGRDHAADRCADGRVFVIEACEVVTGLEGIHVEF
mgnify:CR=1 FL=1